MVFFGENVSFIVLLHYTSGQKRLQDEFDRHVYMNYIVLIVWYPTLGSLELVSICERDNL